MKSWLTYICLFAGCILTLASCTPEAAFDVPTNETSVELTLSYSGDGPMSRDVGSPDEDLDYTTPEQCALHVDDIFVLAFEQASNGTLTLLDILQDLQLTQVNGNDYTWTITGRMPQQGADKSICFVVLTNLVQNGIVIDGATLDSKAAVETALKGMIGDEATDIYEKLIYNYNAQQGLWVIENRRIPMWGISTTTQLNKSEINLPAMDLYRAVAKVQIWVSNKNGIAGQDGQSGTADDFIIKNITVNKANSKGYCVSLLTPDPSETIQYTAPSVPSYTAQTIEFTVTDGDSNQDGANDARQAFSDMIYIPEQFNIGSGSTPITISVEYSYNGKDYTGDKAGIIEFIDSNTQAPFDVIRNHSYIFNIASVNTAEDVKFTLQYEVIEWTTVTNPTLNFGNGDGDVTK